MTEPHNESQLHNGAMPRTILPGEGRAIDADPDNRPFYPMKRLTGHDHEGMSWDAPRLQKGKAEILCSIERPRMTAVYGSAHPPSGISGMIRRFAFRYSESSLGHWMPLLLADRINVVEGIFADLIRGRIPNIFAEMGLKAAWRYNRRGVITKAAVAGLAIGGLALWLVCRKK